MNRLTDAELVERLKMLAHEHNKLCEQLNRVLDAHRYAWKDNSTYADAFTDLLAALTAERDAIAQKVSDYERELKRGKMEPTLLPPCEKCAELTERCAVMEDAIVSTLATIEMCKIAPGSGSADNVTVTQIAVDGLRDATAHLKGPNE